MASSSATPANASITRGDGFSIKYRFKGSRASTRPVSPKAHAAAVATSPLRSVSNSISVASISPPARTRRRAYRWVCMSQERQRRQAEVRREAAKLRFAAAARFGPCTVPLTII